MPEFHELQIPGLAVLVCGVIADVDPLPVVTAPVPLVEESRRRVLRHVLEQVRDLCVAEDRHVLGGQGMAVCVIRIVLRGIVLGDDRVEREIHEQPAIPGPEYPVDHLRYPEGPRDPVQDEERPDPQAAASGEGRFLFWNLISRKALEEVLVRVHEVAVRPVLLAYADPFRRVVFLVRVIFTGTLEVYVSASLDGDPDDMLGGYGNSEVEVHYNKTMN